MTLERDKSITKTKTGKESSSGTGGVSFLVLHNDDVNTFDFVINCLIEICGHDTVQAEQCTYLVHYKGRCDVMKDIYNKLLPYRDALIRKGLKASIE